MDANDVRIFCALAVSGPPDPISASRPPGIGKVARELGLDTKTVRARLRRLEDEGFIKYYQAAPDLALLGLRSELTCRFEAVNLATKRAALHFARERPGMVEALDFLGPGFVVSVAAPSAPEAMDVQRSIAHHGELDRVELGRRELTGPSAGLSSIDWRIIERIRYDARAPVEEVASSTGITPRMVRYRLGKLRSSGALAIRPMIDARKLRGLVVYRLTVTPVASAGGEVLAALQRRFGSQIWALRAVPGGPLLLDMFGENLADTEEAAVAVLDVPGVDACSAQALKEILEPPQASWVDRAIAELAAGRPPPARPAG